LDEKGLGKPIVSFPQCIACPMTLKKSKKILQITFKPKTLEK
jgi:hypothetical protein